MVVSWPVPLCTRKPSFIRLFEGRASTAYHRVTARSQQSGGNSGGNFSHLFRPRHPLPVPHTYGSKP
jgi:hypothetical protein